MGTRRTKRFLLAGWRRFVRIISPKFTGFFARHYLNGSTLMDIWKALDTLFARTIENGATPTEAAVAAEEAGKLMVKYGIDMTAVTERKKWKVRQANKLRKKVWRGRAKAASPVRRIDPKTGDVLPIKVISRTTKPAETDRTNRK